MRSAQGNTQGINLDRILYLKAQRILKNDLTVEYNNKLYQIKDKVNARKIVIEERISGTKIMIYRNKILKFREITSRASHGTLLNGTHMCLAHFSVFVFSSFTLKKL